MAKARCGRCGGYDERCRDLDGIMRNRRFDWSVGGVCADVAFLGQDPQQTLTDGFCPRDGTPIALYHQPDDVDGYVREHFWWQCKRGHTYYTEYDREMREYAPVWGG